MKATGGTGATSGGHGEAAGRRSSAEKRGGLGWCWWRGGGDVRPGKGPGVEQFEREGKLNRVPGRQAAYEGDKLPPRRIFGSLAGRVFFWGGVEVPGARRGAAPP